MAKGNGLRWRMRRSGVELAMIIMGHGVYIFTIQHDTTQTCETFQGLKE
jgi:hypothetical protein